MTFVLDTDIATLAFKRNERVARRVAEHPADSIAISQATRLEILRGRIDAVIKAATGDELRLAVARLADSEAFLASFTVILPINEATTEHYGRLRADKKLNKVGPGDILHAAIALAHGVTLVTRNMKDYTNVPNLKVENWAD